MLRPYIPLKMSQTKPKSKTICDNAHIVLKEIIWHNYCDVICCVEKTFFRRGEEEEEKEEEEEAYYTTRRLYRATFADAQEHRTHMVFIYNVFSSIDSFCSSPGASFQNRACFGIPKNTVSTDKMKRVLEARHAKARLLLMCHTP
jgi:hypothetical protein